MHERDGRRVRVYRFEPAEGPLLGSYLVAPGMHYLGPTDPRMDRFGRVLAAAGFLVDAVTLPEHMALRLSPLTNRDFALGFDALEEHSRLRGVRTKPALFSISFGSLPALAVAADPAYAARVGALVLFGGFGDFEGTIRFCVTGRTHWKQQPLAVPFDPLNGPVVWLNLLEELPFSCDKEAVARAWRLLVERTWGRPEFKVGDARGLHARALGDALGPKERELFLLGAGLAGDTETLLDECLALARPRLGFAYATQYLPRVRAPVAIVHGRDDDVIPWWQALALAEGLAPGHPHRVLLTGLYSHSNNEGVSLRGLGVELETMVQVLRCMRDAPSAPERIGR